MFSDDGWIRVYVRLSRYFYSNQRIEKHVGVFHFTNIQYFIWNEHLRITMSRHHIKRHFTFNHTFYPCKLKTSLRRLHKNTKKIQQNLKNTKQFPAKCYMLSGDSKFPLDLNISVALWWTGNQLFHDIMRKTPQCLYAWSICEVKTTFFKKRKKLKEPALNRKCQHMQQIIKLHKLCFPYCALFISSVWQVGQLVYSVFIFTKVCTAVSRIMITKHSYPAAIRRKPILCWFSLFQILCKCSQITP